MEKANESATNGVDHQEEEDPMVNMNEDDAAKTRLKGDGDESKIKFTTVNLTEGKNGEAKVDIDLVHTCIGMGKEELMKYAKDPFWIRLRLFLFILFWVSWVGMLVGAVAIILLAPRCPPAPKLEWYQRNAMYQVDIGGFKDSDGDGIGDIKGLISELDYFKSINVKTLLLSSFYPTAPDSDAILNHTEIDSRYGTMEDFTELVTELKNKDMKVVIDFIPNHSSDEHAWFKASLKGESRYKDYYVWATSEDGIPSNWLSVNGGSSWEYSPERNRYYLHTYGKDEPDLNLRNEDVRNELESILRFWLEKDVDGFKIVSASHLIEDAARRDEPLNTDRKVDRPNYGDLNHLYTVDLLENVELFVLWRDILSNFSGSDDMRKILLAELSGHLNASVPYYGNSSYPLIDFPINTQLTELTETSTALELKDLIEKWTQSVPEYIWPNWMLGNQRTKRLADRIGHDLIDGLHMIAGLARGTPITYYGDELGMMGITQPGQDKAVAVNLMLWSNDTASVVASQLGVTIPPAFQSINVEEERKNKRSHLSTFGKILELRNQPAINFGFQEFPLVDEAIFSLMRIRKGSPAYLVAINMGDNSTVVNFQEKSSYLPENAHVEVRSKNIVEGPISEGEHPKIKLNAVPLGSKQSVVLSFVPQFQD